LRDPEVGQRTLQVLIQVTFARRDLLQSPRNIVVQSIYLASSLVHRRVNGFDEAVNLFNVVSPVLKRLGRATAENSYHTKRMQAFQTIQDQLISLTDFRNEVRTPQLS
jgi:hypothetical protein